MYEGFALLLYIFYHSEYITFEGTLESSILLSSLPHLLSTLLFSHGIRASALILGASIGLPRGRRWRSTLPAAGP